MVELASDVTHTQSSTNLEDVTGMSFPVVSGGTYSWILFLLHNTSAAADIDVAYSVPAGAGRHSGTVLSGTATGLTAKIQLIGAGADATSFCWAHYQPTADGTIQLRFAQRGSEASDTKVLDGTTLIVWRSA